MSQKASMSLFILSVKNRMIIYFEIVFCQMKKAVNISTEGINRAKIVPRENEILLNPLFIVFHSYPFKLEYAREKTIFTKFVRKWLNLR